MAARRKPTSKLKRKRDTRPSAAKRGYNYKWQKSRKKALGKGKKCAKCGKPAKHRDHTSYKPVRTRWLCVSCHNRKSATNKHKKGKR
jgi:hypothetical protein